MTLPYPAETHLSNVTAVSPNRVGASLPAQLPSELYYADLAYPPGNPGLNCVDPNYAGCTPVGTGPMVVPATASTPAYQNFVTDTAALQTAIPDTVISTTSGLVVFAICQINGPSTLSARLIGSNNGAGAGIDFTIGLGFLKLVPGGAAPITLAMPGIVDGAWVAVALYLNALKGTSTGVDFTHRTTDGTNSPTVVTGNAPASLTPGGNLQIGGSPATMQTGTLSLRTLQMFAAATAQLPSIAYLDSFVTAQRINLGEDGLNGF